MSDAAFREALAKLCAAYARNLSAWGAYDDEVDAARARVLALYAERQGECPNCKASREGNKQ